MGHSLNPMQTLQAHSMCGEGMLRGHHAFMQEASLGSRLQKEVAMIWSVDLSVMANHSMLLVPCLKFLMQDLKADRIRVTVNLDMHTQCKVLYKKQKACLADQLWIDFSNKRPVWTSVAAGSLTNVQSSSNAQCVKPDL